MKLFKAFVFSVINRLFKIVGWHTIFINRSGVKCINQSLSSKYLRSLKAIKEIDLNPENLYLGFDGLKDEFTLVDYSIKSSPHFEFIQILNSQKDYRKTDYYKRFMGGELDLRYNQYPALYDFKTLFESKKRFIEANTILPILISEINKRYYILDGKHTAALSLVMGKRIKCLVIDNPYNHPFYKSLYDQMKKDESNFLKNITFLKMAFAE